MGLKERTFGRRATDAPPVVRGPAERTRWEGVAQAQRRTGRSFRI
jgi:hypothetical protein